MPSSSTTTSPNRSECALFEVALSELAEHSTTTDREIETSTRLERHLANCLRCQAELAQYRKLRRALAALRDEVMTPDSDLLGELLAAVGPGASVHKLHRLTPRTRRTAYIGGIAAATGVTAGAIVFASKLASRQRLAG